MFGRRQKLEERILSTGTHARAVVLDAREVSRHSSDARDDDLLHGDWSVYDVDLQVTADHGEKFDSHVRTRWWDFAGFLHDGREVEVVYDPESRVVVVDDEHALRERRAQREQQLSQWADACQQLNSADGPKPAGISEIALSAEGSWSPRLIRNGDDD